MAGQAKRLVLIKVDGLPAGLMEQYVNQADPATGRSLLPWIRSIFIERGAWLSDFYVRGISLSAPSWSMLDTGQHATLHGNADFDRFSPRVFDYLNFFPFYRANARQNRADMPAVETLDQFGVPLLLDRFGPQERYQSAQLFQRGVRWTTLRDSIANRVLRPARDLVNEWATGFEVSPGLEEQEEKEMIQALANPKIVYLDFFTGDYDHTAHLTEDEPSQLAVLQQLDARVGRIWKAIQASPLAASTILAMVSDHGMNSVPGTYSQGYNLVNFLNSTEGGGHHVVTVRHPLTEFKLLGLDPFVSYVVTPSPAASYLHDQSNYPTALLDPDGNERAALQLRNSDLNAIHILLLQLKRTDLTMPQRGAVENGILSIVEANRARWSKTVGEVNQELAALHRLADRQQELIASTKRRWRKEDRAADLEQTAWRRRVSLETWRTDESDYKEYTQALTRLLDLKKADLEPSRIRIESLVLKGVMGPSNFVGQLQNYVAGLSHRGIVLTSGGALDLANTFERVDYFSRLSQVHARNAVQSDVGTAPIDFLAARVAGDQPDADAVLVYADEQHEGLLLSRTEAGKLWLRYLPVRDFIQDATGAVHYTIAPWADGLPLRLLEDPALLVSGDRKRWLSEWHTEQEWFEAIHRTRYSNGLIGLHEYFERWQPPSIPMAFRIAEQSDWPVLRRFVARRRELTESDLLILAADHWNFNVRGFNPGGNHGSFLRISTHSVFMAAGAEIPCGLEIERPYDSLSVAPTLLSLLGRLPTEQAGDFPGPVIEELFRPPAGAHLTTVTGCSSDFKSVSRN